MDRELLTETIRKRPVSTRKINIANDIDNAYISIRASPAWDVDEWFVLQEVSQDLLEMLHLH
jgi:hypothetical protein